MFEKLIELITQFWNRLSPCQIIRIFETGAVLRFGIYHRTALPGLCWKWPVVEDVFEVPTVITTLRLPAQTLTTKDGVGVVVAAIVKFKIEDIKPYVTAIWDQGDVLADVSMGAIRRTVGAMTYDDLLVGDPERQVIAAVRKEVNQYGFRVLNVTFTDLGRVRSLRLIQQVAKDILN